MRCRPLGLLLSGVVVASSACSMDSTAPSSLAPTAPAARASGPWNGGANWNESGNHHDGEWGSDGLGGDAAPSTYVATIDPRRRNVLRFGAYTLDVAGRAICDQSSGYGLELFDQTCKPESDPVTITAVVRAAADGTPRIDLMPEMRFSPDRTVTLILSVPNGAPEPSARMLYCATPSTTACVDEAEFDPTLTTHVDVEAGTVFRRIKHFSGYFVEW